MAKGIKQLRSLQISSEEYGFNYFLTVLETVEIQFGGTKLEFQEGVNEIPRDPKGMPQGSKISCKIEATVKETELIMNAIDMNIIAVFLDGQAVSMTGGAFTGEKKWVGSERSLEFEAMSASPLATIDTSP